MAEKSTSRLAKILRKMGPVKPDEPVGVIDIGSNSIRIVGYSGTARTPLPIYNERAFCRLGVSVKQSGKIEGSHKDHALATFRRFRAIADQLGIKRLSAFATAAVRVAINSQEFVADATEILRTPVRVLNEEEEAFYSAHGVMMAIPRANGLVADLGGGSLELAHVENGEILNWASLNIGVLSLVDDALNTQERLQAEIQKHLSSVSWLSETKFGQLYAVGGTWRNLAAVFMAQTNYGLPVLHQFEFPSRAAKEFLAVVAGLSEEATAALNQASKNRRQSLPIAARLMLALVDHARIKRVIISATGVREGVLVQTLLPNGYRKTDPLLLACEEMAERQSKSAVYGHELVEWTEHLLDELGHVRDFARYRRAACLVSDIAWSQHPKSRADIAAQSVLRAPFNGITHEGRVMMAYALAHRHEIEDEGKILLGLPRFTDAENAGKILGLSFRLAHSLSASMPGVLLKTKIKVESKELILDVRNAPSALIAPIIESRLLRLAQAMGRTPKLVTS